MDPSQKPTAEPDNNLLCPITLTIMADPVVTECGMTYERSAITEHLTKNSFDPTTRGALKRRRGAFLLTPNMAIRSQIAQFVTLHGVPSEWESLALKCARAADFDTVSRLVNFGINIEGRDADGHNLLYYAAMDLNKPLWTLLLAKKADPESLADSKSESTCKAFREMTCVKKLQVVYNNRDFAVSGRIAATKKSLDKLVATQELLRDAWAGSML